MSEIRIDIFVEKMVFAGKSSFTLAMGMILAEKNIESSG
jgi:hypothetical protein